jgi:aarF domain-containing kinase
LKDFPFDWIADELAPQLPKELDYTFVEGKNAKKAQACVKDSLLACCIHKIMWRNATLRVQLTMKFEEGFTATDINKIEVFWPPWLVNFLQR